MIAEVGSLAELEEYQEVERAAWGMESVQEAVPAHLTVTHQRYGGLLLGAREPGGRMVAMLLGFPGLKGGRLLHCSHMMGVIPDWRGRDVGYRMKCWQRLWVLDRGVDLVVWTFDPLETRNARLNIGRLGGICREYHPNLYGVMNDGLNQGLESDRLLVEWYIRTTAVEDRLQGRLPSLRPGELLAAGTPLLTRTAPRQLPEGGPAVPILSDVLTGHDAPQLLVEAPARFQALKAADAGAARAWRLGLRTVLQDLFARGYAALDLLYDAAAGRCYYLIGRADDRLPADHPS